MDYQLDGNFVIDKNINKGYYQPSSFLVPEPNYHFIDGRTIQKDYYPRFLQKNNNGNYHNSKTIQKTNDNSKNFERSNKGNNDFDNENSKYSNEFNSMDCNY